MRMFLVGQSVIYKPKHRKRGVVQEPLKGNIISVSSCGTKINMRYYISGVSKRITVSANAVEVLNENTGA